MPDSKALTDLQVHTVGTWQPKDKKTLNSWVSRRIAHHDKWGIHPDEWDETVVALQELLERDANVREMCTTMFREIPHTYDEVPPPFNKPQVRDYMHMLSVFNNCIRTAPEWFDVENGSGLIGSPINAILDWPMGTMSGHYFFKHPEVNKRLKAMLNRWGTFLRSKKSTEVLRASKHGWLAEQGLAALTAKADGTSFTKLFKTPDISNTETYGYTSWDDFFVREFNEGVRPVFVPKHPETGEPMPEDKEANDKIIVSACESIPLRISKDVRPRDRFWLKDQPYSLRDMLDSRDLARYSAGGTVYQAFLSALSYHRWHAPISGTVKSVHYIDGTYYSSAKYEGFAKQVSGEGDPDPAAPDHSQQYITAVAARAVMTMEADNQDLGTVAMVTVGMAKCSSSDFTIYPGQHINKGDDIGMFHFGGSTHCLIFRSGLDLQFLNKPPENPDDYAENVKVKDFLATYEVMY